MSAPEASALLLKLGAPAHLRRHAALVAQVASELSDALIASGLTLDPHWVRQGALLHDLGKTLHPQELHSPGVLHEEAGYALALSHGVEEALARCCITHARWHEATRFEELVIALADKLWKGKRAQSLEEHLIAQAQAQLPELEPWSLYTTLDSLFERIAAGGDARLTAQC